MQRILFLVTISITTLALSLFSARVYTTVLRSGSAGIRTGMIISALFPIVFITANLIGRLGENLLIRTFTIVSNVVAGLAFYLLITAIILGVVLIVGQIFSIIIPQKIAFYSLALAALFTIVGLIQARFIIVRNNTITLTGAPESWNGKRAVLISDTHFGLVNSAGFAQKVVSRIDTLHPDLVLFAGDMYDGPTIKTEAIVTAWKALTQHTPVFYAPGNHETYGPYGTFIDSAKAAGFTVLDDKKVEYEGVQITGITYRAKNDEAVVGDVLQNLNLDETMATILINHPPTFTETVKKYGIDLMVSGHTHNGQFWPLGYVTKMIYGKFNHGLAQDQKLTVITTSGVGTAGPPMRLFNRPEIVEITFRTK